MRIDTSPIFDQTGKSTRNEPVQIISTNANDDSVSEVTIYKNAVRDDTGRNRDSSSSEEINQHK